MDSLSELRGLELSEKTYYANVMEVTTDGEAILELPDELVKDLGWNIGDVLDFELVNDAVIIRNLTKENNERRDDNTPSDG